MENITNERGDKIIGICQYPFNGDCGKFLYECIEEFNQMQMELKNHYGQKNVWFDRDRENNRILFLTH